MSTTFELGLCYMQTATQYFASAPSLGSISFHLHNILFLKCQLSQVVDLSLYRNKNKKQCTDFHPQDLCNSPHHSPHPILLHRSSSNLKLTESSGGHKFPILHRPPYSQGSPNSSVADMNVPTPLMQALLSQQHFSSLASLGKQSNQQEQQQQQQLQASYPQPSLSSQLQQQQQ